MLDIGCADADFRTFREGELPALLAALRADAVRDAEFALPAAAEDRRQLCEALAQTRAVRLLFVFRSPWSTFSEWRISASLSLCCIGIDL